MRALTSEAREVLVENIAAALAMNQARVAEAIGLKSGEINLLKVADLMIEMFVKSSVESLEGPKKDWVPAPAWRHTWSGRALASCTLGVFWAVAQRGDLSDRDREILTALEHDPGATAILGAIRCPEKHLVIAVGPGYRITPLAVTRWAWQARVLARWLVFLVTVGTIRVKATSFRVASIQFSRSKGLARGEA